MNKPTFEPTKKHRLVRVEWIDSVATKGNPWSHLDEVVAQTDMSCVSVGWIVHQDDVAIVIVSHFTAGDQVCGDFRIPRRAILEIRDIATVAPVFTEEEPGPTDDQPLLCPYCSKHHWRDVKCPPGEKPVPCPYCSKKHRWNAACPPLEVSLDKPPPVPGERPESRPAPRSLICGFCGDVHAFTGDCLEFHISHEAPWWCHVCGLHAAKAACPNTTYFCSSCGVRHENGRHSAPYRTSRDIDPLGKPDDTPF